VDAKVFKDLYEGGNYYISKTAQAHPVTMLLLMPEHQRQSTQGKYTTIHKGELSQINIYDKNIEHTKISLFT